MIFKNVANHEKMQADEKEKLMSVDYWTSFLKTSAMHYKHSFDIQVSIHKYKPDSIACAGHSFWLKNDCKVAENAKPVYYQQDEKLYRFYDIDDVSGDFKENYWIWSMRDEKLDADFSEAVNRKLTVQYKLDDTSLEQTIYNVVLQKTAEKINVNSDLYAVVTESAAFAVIHRCCPGAVEMSNENLSALGKIDINEIGENVTAITKEVLSEIENMVKAERTAIIDRSKLYEYNNDKQRDMPVKATGQVELSDSENTGRENLHIGQSDVSLLSAQQQADRLANDNVGGLSEATGNSERTRTAGSTVLNEEKENSWVANYENNSETENKAPEIIGNTVFKYIPQKTYRKFDKDKGLKIANQLEAQGIKYSGKIDNDTVTLTVSKADVSKVEELSADIDDDTDFEIFENNTIKVEVNSPMANESKVSEITQADIDILRTLEPRKSVLNFSAEEIKLTENWQNRFDEDIKEKSPYYRNVNGDWRENDENRVDIINIEDRNVDFKSVRDDIKSQVIPRGIVVNNDTNWEIQVSRTGLEDTVAYGHKYHNDIVYKALYKIDDILQNSIYLDTTLSEHNNNNKSSKTIFMHKLYNIISINDEKYLAKLAVEEFPNNDFSPIRRLYNLQDIKIEPLRHIGLADNQLRHSVLNGSDISISDLFKIVKASDKDFYVNKREKSMIADKVNTEMHEPVTEVFDTPEIPFAVGDVISYDGAIFDNGDVDWNVSRIDTNNNRITITRETGNIVIPQESQSLFLNEVVEYVKQHTQAEQRNEKVDENSGTNSKHLNSYMLGSFYEFRGHDADTVASLLNFQVTSRKGENIVGIPKHYYDEVKGKLEAFGYTINFINENDKHVTVDYADAFFVNEENQTVRWLYFNPDSDAGGQYVENNLSFDNIIEASKDIDNAHDFFDYLGSIAEQHLFDIDYYMFEYIQEDFLSTPDFKDCTEDTMKGLTEVCHLLTLTDKIEALGLSAEADVVNDNEEIPSLFDVDYSVEKSTSEVSYNKILDENNTQEFVGGAKAKFKNNIKAIKLLKQIETENRSAAEHEKEILSRYVGWGGVSEAFNPNNPSWQKEYTELKELLTDSEYKAAKASVLDSFYTSPVVIESIYSALDKFGFKSGTILEPSMGVGNFFKAMPQSMKDGSKLYGVELDSISGRIAQQIYPDADIQVKGYEKTDFEDNFFDVAVGNIPFGNFKVSDRKYDSNNFLIHDYFIAKTLDKVRSGGIVAFVTSTGTLDKVSPQVRKYISQRAELLGAIRLPNDAFKNAGTKIASDIIFLKKREEMITLVPDWVYTDKDDNGFTMNSYFVNNPDMILGEVTESSFYGRGISVKPFENADMKVLLDNAVNNISGSYTARSSQPIIKHTEAAIPANPDVRDFSYTEVDGKIYYRENNYMTLQNFTGKKLERVKGMIKISVCTHELLGMQLNGYAESELSEKRDELNRIYDSFTSEYGLLNSRENANIFHDDVSAPLLLSLEILKDGKLERKAEIFSKTTLKAPEPVKSVSNSHDALIVSISEKAKVDIDFMLSLIDGKSKDELIADLKGDIYLNPATNEYETADEYLSGNIRKKIEIAKEFCHENVPTLEAVMPEPIGTDDITAQLGSSWIDTKYIEQFIIEKLNIPFYCRSSVNVEHSELTATWNIENKSGIRNLSMVASTETYGTKRKNALEIIESSLNQRDITVWDAVYNSETDKEERVVNHDETLLARQKQQILEREFKEWIFEDAERRTALTEKYNVLFNSTRLREYDGSHLNFEGMNADITLHTHQKNAIAHALYGGNTLFAHKVGAGKTYEMIATAMEGKRLGLHTKSLIAVPNHMTLQFANDFLKLYPNANILVAGKQDFSKANRQKLCAKIATGNFDAVIIGHSQLLKIPVSKEREEKYIQNQIDELVMHIAEEKIKDSKSFTVKDLERTKKRLETKLTKLLDKPVRDSVVTFEELGIDKLIIDEADKFKNLGIVTKMSNVSGIAANDNIQKTQDLYLKCRYINDITGGKGVVFATGTPISNSISEAYIMNKYLKPELLDENGVGSFDAWIANFAQRVTKLEFSPTGKGFRQKTRISKFNNLPELMKMFKEFSDIKMAEDLNLEEPECERIIINAPRSEIQKELMDSLAKRAEAIQNKEVSPEIDNMLKLTTDGTKIGLDPRLINDMLPDFPDGKVNKCINNVYEIYNQTAAEKLTQVIFCDYSTPKYNGQFTVYEDIKKKLVDMGIPKEQVVFIHDCKNDKQKQELFDKVKNGDVRILLGSTEKMGAGTNIQDRLYAMHHLDAPWKPRDMEQRLGRMKRQGNINEKVYEYIYVSQDTFDAYRFQTLETKQGYISQIMTNGNPLRSCDDVSPEEMSFAAVKAACVGNPLIKEKMELDIEVNNLQTLKTAFLNSRYRLEDDVSTKIPKRIDETKTHLEATQKDIENVNKYPLKYDADGNTVFYGMTICDKFYSDKKEATQALMKTIPKLLTGNEGKAIDIGTYKYFKLQVLFDALSQEMKMRICGHETYTITLSGSESGNIMRIDNKINAIPEIAEECKMKLNTLTQQLTDAKAELEKPFPQEAELKEKLQRLDYLNVELSKDDGDKLLGENNSKSFELATEEEKQAAEEREKQRKEKELNGDIDFDL